MIPPSRPLLDISLLMQAMLHPWVLILFLFGSLLLAVEIGRRYGWRRGDRLRIDTQGATNLSAAVIYVTIDMEFPRVGFIRLDGFEKAINALDPPI